MANLSKKDVVKFLKDEYQIYRSSSVHGVNPAKLSNSKAFVFSTTDNPSEIQFRFFEKQKSVTSPDKLSLSEEETKWIQSLKINAGEISDVKHTTGILQKAAAKVKYTLLPNQNEDVLNFTQEFFKLIAEDIKDTKQEETRIQDNFAHLLLGEETNSSTMAISGGSLLIHTAQNLHLNSSIRVEKSYKLLKREGSDIISRYEIEFYAKLIHITNNGTQIQSVERGSGTCIFEYDSTEKLYQLKEGNPTIWFTQQELKVQFYGDDKLPIFVEGPINTSSKKEDFQFLSNETKIGVILPLEQKYPIIETGPFQKRIFYLFKHLSSIALAAISKPDSEINKRVTEQVEKNIGWIEFLKNSLTYELSKHPLYREHVRPYNHNHPATKQLHDFYEWLLSDYQKYKREQKVKTSVDSIKDWTETVYAKPLPAPTFLSLNLTHFMKQALQYFIDLMEIEKFVEVDAKQGGRFSSILLREKFYEKNPEIILINNNYDHKVQEEKKNNNSGTTEHVIHNEMKLWIYHLKNLSDPSKYFGLKKICCGHCHVIMKSWKLNDVRGHFPSLVPYWLIPKEILEEKLIQVWLGTSWFKYQSLTEAQKKYVLELIPNLSILNDSTTLVELGIDPSYKIPEFEKPEPKPLPKHLARDKVIVVAGMKKQMMTDKYSLKDTSPSEIEKGVRRAAANGEVADLQFFVNNFKVNVNAQAPDSKKSALHWAANAKNYAPLMFHELLHHGAKLELVDSNGKKPLDLANKGVKEYITKIVID